MTVELSAVASNTTANLNGATQTVNYTITPTGTPDENECTPADTTAPDPPSTPDLDAASDSGSSDTDNVTNDNKPDFSGTAEANSTVELFADATSLGTTTADASGNWSFDGASILTSALADDTYSITAKATDASNNTSGASGALSVTIDTVANAPTGLDLTTDTGTSPTDDITNDKTPTIEGSAEANGSVELFEGTTSLGTGSASETNAWSINSSALSDGQHTLKAKVTDVAGNPSGLSSGLVVTIDTVKPTVEVSGFENGDIFYKNDPNSTLPTPGCSISDPSPTSGLYSQSSSPVLKPGTGLNSDGVGSATYTCSATDNAGNSNSDEESYSVKYARSGGILQPINPDNTSIFSRGRAVPVKFQLSFDEPTGFNTSGWTLGRIQVNCSTGFDLDDAVVEPVPSNTPSTVFRYDSSADQYIYNADFKSAAAGTCWKVTVNLGDSSTPLTSAVFKMQK
jgi:hypothetical protein